MLARIKSRTGIAMSVLDKQIGELRRRLNATGDLSHRAIRPAWSHQLRLDLAGQPERNEANVITALSCDEAFAGAIVFDERGSPPPRRERQLRSKTLPGLIVLLQHQVDQLGQEAAHRRRAAVQTDVREEQLLPSSRRRAARRRSRPIRPGGRQRIACIIDSCVPTHSSTESAPTPSVSSLMRATPSSPRSVTMSVAPNSRASSAAPRGGSSR